MASTQTGTPVGEKPLASNSSWLGAALADLPYALAFLQFMLVVLPYGFLSFVGSNLPYTDNTAMAGFIILLVCSGPALAFMAFILMKLQRKYSDPGSNKSLLEKYPSLLPIVSYANAIMGIVMYFIESNGWLPDFEPVLIYWLGVLLSGFLAMLGLMTRRGSRDVPAPGLPFGLAAVVIGFLYLIPASADIEGLWLVQIIIAIAIPPIASLDRLGGRTFSAPAEPVETKAPFAWCDKFLATGDGPRTFMGTALMLLLTLNLVNLFAAILYLKIPGVNYGILSLMFFIGMGAAIVVFSTAFKSRSTTILFFITIGITVACMILNDFIPRFGINPGSLLLSGCGTGGVVTLLLRAQATRNGSLHLKDFAGNRVLETFFYVLLASVFGLVFNWTISWEALRIDLPGFIPARTLFGGVILAIVNITFAIFTANARYLSGVERGVVRKKAESMEELVSGGSKGVDPTVAAMLGGGTPSKKTKDKGTDAKAKEVDPMVAGMLGGGMPSKKAKDKSADSKPKEVDPMVAGMLGGGTTKKKELEIVPKPVVPVPSAPVPAKLAPVQVPDRIRKIKALLLISKRVKIENVREALGLDNEICDIVLGIWTNELGIEVSGGFVDFKDIEIEKIVNILEAFLAEWNKPEGNDAMT